MKSLGASSDRGAVADVLAGRVPYDALAEREQAAVRVAWDHAIADTIDGLDYELGFLAEGESWAEADAHGHVVFRSPIGDHDPSDGPSLA